MQHQTLYCGDCLDWMAKWDDEIVDLIYLDPPFNSNATYKMLFEIGDGSSAPTRAFSDTWRWDAMAADRFQRITDSVEHPAHNAILGLHQMLGNSGMLAYLTYMAERLVEMRRILTTSGSIYYHCDSVASHYVRVLMDCIFGASNFRNDIVWAYRTGGVSTRYWPRKHDTILFYVKSDAYKHRPLQERVYYEKRFFSAQSDESGRYYADVYVRDVWSDIKPVINVSSERVGYPTQKPVELLKRVISASSAPGDKVLDPFCGSGTAIIVAHELGREWAGIDISPLAVDVVQKSRLYPLGIEAKVKRFCQNQDLEN